MSLLSPTPLNGGDRRRRRVLRTGVDQLIRLTEPDLELHQRMPEAERRAKDFAEAHAAVLKAGALVGFIALVVLFSTVGAGVFDYLFIYDLVQAKVGARLGPFTGPAIVLVTAMLLFLELRVGLELAAAVHNRDDEGWLSVLKWGALAAVLLLVVPLGVLATFIIGAYPAVYRPMLVFEIALCLAAHAVILGGAGSLAEAVNWLFTRRTAARLERAVQQARAAHEALLTRVRQIAVTLNDTVEAANAAGHPLLLPPLPLATRALAHEAFGIPVLGGEAGDGAPSQAAEIPAAQAEGGAPPEGGQTPDSPPPDDAAATLEEENEALRERLRREMGREA
jgi:hypothetical protein